MFYLVADDRSLSLSIYWSGRDELFSVFFFYSNADYEDAKDYLVEMI